MDKIVFIFLLFGLQLLCWLMGRRASKNVQSREDYFLAGKSVRVIPLMMTFLATQIGGGTILGAAEEAFQFGWPVLFYSFGTVLGLILLGAGIGRKLASFQVSTVAQIFEVVYRSALLRKIASILSVISLFMILIAQIIASSKFLISLGLNNTPFFIAFWAVVILYTVQGGLKAVISTDLIQAAFFSVVFLFSFAFIIFSNAETSMMPMPQLDSFVRVSSKWCGWFLMPLCFMFIEQDMGQRCFAAASPRTVSKATWFAAMGTMIICVVPVFLGCLAKAIDLKIPEGGSVLMTIITKTTNPFMTSIVGCAILVAIISTATSLINAISSNVSNDFKWTFFERVNPVRVAQGITCIISITAVFFAFCFDNIIGLLIQSYELSVSCLFIPLVFALFKKKGSFISAIGSVFCGALGFCLFRLYPLGFPQEIANIILSLLGYIIGDVTTSLYKKSTYAILREKEKRI